MTTAGKTTKPPTSPVATTTVNATRPFHWLSLGFDDLRRQGASSIAYGVLVAAIGLSLLVMLRHPYTIAAAVSGFLLVAPLLATGLCEMSRQRESGALVGFDASLQALNRNRSALLVFSACLVGAGAAWFFLSGVILYVRLPESSAGMSLWGGVFDQIGLYQSFYYIVVGGVLACGVFAVSVISVPLLIDRDLDAFQAMRTSLEATRNNLGAMLIWASLIVVLVGIGYLTFLIGLIVIFPWLGHATWHAYRDLARR